MSIYRELSYDQEIDTVRGVQFSILGPDEIRRRSVVEVTKTDTYAGNEPVIGGLFDSRMGVLEHNRYCTTCEQKNIFCPGHFGHINLARPIFHPMLFEYIPKLLKCICYRCSRLLVSPTESKEEFREKARAALATKSMYKRWEIMTTVCDNVKIKRCGDDGAPGCGAKRPSKYTKEGVLKIIGTWEEGARELSAEEVLRILERITEEDMEALGFNPRWMRPEWMVCTVLPVPPPAVRPSIIEENGQRREDDLTHRLCDIVKTNNQLQARIEKGNASEENLKIITQVLQYHVATFMNNQMPGLPPAQQRNGRKLKSITDRLKKKEGRIRGNLNGKRVDQSARSVITPDPFLSLDEVGMPVRIAMTLTFPEIVNSYNIAQMQEYVRNGPDVWPGARYIRAAGENVTKSLKYTDREKVARELKPGDIIDRHVMDGDYVLFNRQPSLHKMSMMGHRVRVMPYQTFRISPTICAPYNADKPMLARGRCPTWGKPF